MNEQTEALMLLYVNSIEKQTRMKYTGLKIPEKAQMYKSDHTIHTKSYYYRAKIIGESFSILSFKC